MKKIVISLLFILLAQPSYAYIPRTQTIVKKMSRNNGRREYQITRDITLESKEKKIKVQETWTVANSNKMKLVVRDIEDNWSFTILYNSKNRKTLTKNNQPKTFKKSPDFFEPLFHDRSRDGLMKQMVSHMFIPQWILSVEAPSYVDGKTKMTPEPFVTLTPMEGSVNYNFSASNNRNGGQNKTALWVEQDSFLIKKGRMRSQAEFVNSNFQRFTGGLKLPRQQTITWGDRVARVQIQNVERVKTKKKDWALQPSKAQPNDPLIKEFYSRFR